MILEIMAELPGFSRGFYVKYAGVFTVGYPDSGKMKSGLEYGEKANAAEMRQHLLNKKENICGL